MNDVLANTWRQLVRRRLWPVALLLLAALVAIPVIVARDAEPVAAPADPVPAESVKADETIGEPIVAMASAADRDRRRRVLGSRKDPFRPAERHCVCPGRAKRKQDKANSAAKPASAAPKAAETAPTGDARVPTVPPGGAPAAPAPAPTPVPVAEPPAPKKPTFPANSLTVRFGDATGELTRTVLERLEALPEETDLATEPLLVYLGLTKDRKSAIFMVDASAEATGDGECKPDPACETLHLRENETEFFDVKDPVTGAIVAQYQLDVVEIHAKRKAAAKQARARRSVARATAARGEVVGSVAGPTQVAF